MADPKPVYTPWRGRFNDVIVGPHAAELVRILPLQRFDGQPLAAEMAAGDALSEALNEIGRTSRSLSRRRPSDPEGWYRRVKLVSVRVPEPTRPPSGQARELAVAQRPWLEHLETYRAVTALTVRLRERGMLRGRRARDAVQEMGRALAVGSITPARVEADRQDMLTATSVAGCRTPVEADWRALQGWYNRGGASNPPIVFHFDHIHFFSSAAWQDLAGLRSRGQVRSIDDCHDWPADLGGWQQDGTPKHWVLSFGSVTGFGGNAPSNTAVSTTFEDDAVAARATDQRVRWVDNAHAAGAWACTATFYLEPGQNVAKELEANQTRIDDDLRRLEATGRWSKAEYERQLDHVQHVRDHYASGGEPAAINVSALIAMPVDYPWHQGFDWDRFSKGLGITVAPVATEHQVREAFTEMQLGSDQMIAPQPGELDTRWLGFSRFAACASPTETKGVFLGPSYADRQPVWLDMDAGRSAEAPFHCCQGATGSGKTTMLGEVLVQGALEGRDGLVGNFKGQDPTYKLYAAMLAKLGVKVRYYGLDDMVGSDGLFDQFKFRRHLDPGSATAEQIAAAKATVVPGAGQRATLQILKVNPWGATVDQIPVGAETALKDWLTQGEKVGARCVGEVLRSHRDEAPHIVDPILRLAESDDMFRMFVGLDPHAPGWSTSGGITIVERGNSQVPFPETADELRTGSERAAAVFVQAFFEGVGYGLAHRAKSPFLIIDEVWLPMAVAKDSMIRAGRQWRALGIYLLMADQKMSTLWPLVEFSNRITVGFSKSDDEARLALQAIGAEVSDRQVATMKTWRYVAGDDGAVGRGSLWLHRDTGGVLTLVESIPNPAWQVTSKMASAEFSRPS